MRYLRTNTACRVTVGPFLDKTDGITPETALTVTSEKLTLVIDDANVPTLVLDTAPTASGGANDMVHITGDDAGFYDLELAAANVNYLGRAMLSLTDAATHCPVFHEFMIIPAVVYDAMILGTDLLDVSMTQILGTAVATPATAGLLDVNAKQWNGLTTVELPLVPTTAGRKLDVSAGGEAGLDWANIGSPTTANALTGTTIATTQKVDVETIKTNPVANAGTVTFPTNATLASTTNITAGTITTVTTVTNQLTAAQIATGIWQDTTAGDFTTVGSIGKSLFTSGAVPGAAGGLFIAGTNAATAVNITGNITGNLSGSVGSVTGAVGSVTGAVGSVTGLTASDVGAIKTKTDFLPSATAGAAGGIFIAGTNAATSITTALTANIVGNITGNLSGSIGSVATDGITALSLATDSVDAAALTQDAVDAIAAAILTTPANLLTTDASGRVGVANIGGDTTTVTNMVRTFRALIIDTMTTGSSTTSLKPANLVGTVADQYKGRIITFRDDTTTAALRGQQTDITASSLATPTTLTVTALTTAPASGDSFTIN